MVKTRQQKKTAKEWRRITRGITSHGYTYMKKYHVLPYRRCLANQSNGRDPLRHPCFSAFAALEQIRKLRPDIPLAPLMYLFPSNLRLWKRVYWRKNYLVPVLTPAHIQLIGIQYTTPTSIAVARFQSNFPELELRRALYQYLPWVRDIHIQIDLSIESINTSLHDMCTPIAMHVLLNVRYENNLFLEFLDIFGKLRNMSAQKRYDTIMDTWQNLMRPTT